MRESILKISAFALLIFLASCSPRVDVAPFGTLPSEPTTGDIDVYTNTSSIAKPYREIALITVDDEGWDRGEGELINTILEEARKIGADGVIILSQETVDKGGTFVAGTYIQSQGKVFKATAIAYNE